MKSPQIPDQDQDLTGYSEHDGRSFCYDMSCPCHENKENIQQTSDDLLDGLITKQEANLIYRGKTV